MTAVLGIGSTTFRVVGRWECTIAEEAVVLERIAMASWSRSLVNDMNPKIGDGPLLIVPFKNKIQKVVRLDDELQVVTK